MKIVMDEQQYQELEDLIGIFDGMFLMMKRCNALNLLKIL